MEPLGRSQMPAAPPPPSCHTLWHPPAGERGSWMVVIGQMPMPLWEQRTLELGGVKGGSLISMATTAQARQNPNVSS